MERIDNACRRGTHGGAGRRVLRIAAVAGLVVAWAALERKRRLEEDAARTTLPSPRVRAPTVAVNSCTRRPDRRRSLTTRLASTVVFALGVVFALTGALEVHASELTTTHSFAAVADAYVNSLEPDANFGRESVLRIDGTNPNSSSRLADSYVRFDVGGLSGPVVSAAVRFHGTKGDNTGFQLRRVADTWSEESITWSNAPTSDSEVIASSGGFDTGAWTTLDVTSAMRGSGSVNLALSSTSPAPMAVASREAGASAPELVVTTTAIVPANETPPSISGTAQQGATLTAALGTWAGAAPVSYSYEWRRCDQGGEDCVSIGASGETHRLTASDVGSTVRVAVTASNAAGQSTAMSAPTAVVTPAATPSPGDSEPPSAPGTPTVTASTPTAVVLAWDASSDNVGVVGYGVYQDGTLVQSTAGPTATIEGLVCGKTYEVSVDAVDAAGNRSQRTPAWVQTAACSDSEPPTAPTNLTLIAKTASSLTLSWLPSSDNVGVTGYHVFLGGVSLLTVTQPGATLQTLTCGTAYTVGVQASDAAGNRSQIATISTATETCPQPPEPGPGDTTPPTQPGNLLVSASTATSVSLTWAASTDDVAVSGYGLYVDGDPVSSATQPAATISGLACGTAYTLAVDAYDAAGNHSTPAEVTAATAACVDALAPSVPANVQASSRTATSISLSWSPSSDNVGVTGYGLYRGGTQVGTTAATAGIFSGLVCNTNYTLAVDAYDAAGNRSQKTTIMVATTSCPDTTPPSTPTGLAASSVTQTGLTLTWNASSDNVGVTGYDVYRSDAKIASVSSTSSSQTGLACGTSYSLAVAASDAAGNVSPQAQASVSTAACSTDPTSYYYAEHFDGAFTNPIWHPEPTGVPSWVPGASGNAIRITNCAVLAPGTCVGGESVGSTSNYGQLAAVNAYSPYAHAGWIPGSGPDLAHGNGQPEDSWYRFKLHFPADYKATPGTQNAIFEFHVDSKTIENARANGSPNAYSTLLAVQADPPSGYTVAIACPGIVNFCTVPGVTPRLMLQVPGGVIPAPNGGVRRYALPSNSLLLDHWYDIALHIYWSPDPAVGHVQWWLDGTKVLDVFQPTLYTRTDGTFSYGENIGAYNYRLWADWASSIDFDELVWGPTAASIGFTP